MRELMIKLIICLMIMFACVSCSSDDDFDNSNEPCAIEYVEDYFNIAMIKNGDINPPINNYIKTYKSYIVDTTIWVISKEFRTFVETNKITRTTDEYGGIYNGNIYGDSIIIREAPKEDYGNTPIAFIYIACKHNKQHRYSD